MAVLANTYHVLPSQVARDLDRDPERSAIECAAMLRYADAHRAFRDTKSPDDLKPWRGSPMMEQVERNTFDLHQKRIAQVEAEHKEKISRG